MDVVVDLDHFSYLVSVVLRGTSLKQRIWQGAFPWIAEQIAIGQDPHILQKRLKYIATTYVSLLTHVLVS